MLRRRVRLKTEDLRLVNEILKTFVRYNNTEKVFDKILQIFYSFWSIEAGFIALKDENGKLRVYTAFGLLPSEVEKAIYSKGEGITGLSYQLGIPLYATEDELINKTGFLKRLYDRNIAFFAAPIKAGDKVIGVIGLFKQTSKNLKVEKILEVLSVVGSILGTYLSLKEKSEIPSSVAWELLKNTDNGKLEGELLLTTGNQRVRDIFYLLERIKNLNVPVLFIGKEGVGKASYARFLHEISHKKNKKIEIIDLRGQSLSKLTNLFEEKLKNIPDGTLLLKRIEYLPIPLQERVLSVIKEGNIRVLATAGEKLKEVYSKGEFIPELYDTLKTFEIYIPSLKERKEDIESLFMFLFNRIRTSLGINVGITSEAVKALVENPPEDNIKGLERLAKKLITIFADKDVITLRDLELVEPGFKGEINEIETNKKIRKTFTEQLAEEEKRKIIEALEMTNYVKSRAAKILGYTLRQLDYRLKKYGIEVKKKN